MTAPASGAQTPPSAPARLWLIPVVALSGALNFARLGDKSLWLDEIHTYRLATMPAHEFWDLVAHREANMVLYYVLLRFWLALGDSELWMRGLSAILAVAATAAVYGLAARLYGRRVGLIAAFLFAINPMVVAYAHEARGYTLFLLLAVGATALLIRAIEGRPRAWLAYVVVASLAIYSHLFGALVVLAHGLAVIGVVPRSALPWRRLVAVAAGIAVLVSPLGVFVATAAGSKLDWVSEPGFRHFVGVFSALAGGKWILLVYAALILVALFVAARKWGTVNLDGQPWGRSLILASWLVVPVVVAFAISQVKPALIPRFFMTGAAPLVILAAVGLDRIRSGVLAGACLLVILGLTIPQLLTHYRANPEDWHGAIEHVVTHASPDDAVVFYTSTGRHALAYYTRRDGVPPLTVIGPTWGNLDDMKSRSEDLDAITRGYPRMWLVLSHVESGPRDAVRQAIEGILHDRYRSMRRWHFNGVRVLSYQDIR